MNQKIMSYIPKSKIEAIKDAYKDEDGYWIILNEGWEASRTDRGCRTIHEDAIKDLRYQIAGIQRITSEEAAVISGNTINGFEFHYNPESNVFIVRYNGSWFDFETVEEVIEFTKEMALKEEAEPDPDNYQNIQDSMTESFYEYCTGEPIPEDWKEIVKEKRKLKSTIKAPTEAVEIVLEDITEDPECHDTPIPPRDPEEPMPGGELTVQELTGPGAAEAVMFGIMMVFAVTWFVTKNVAELLALTAGMLLIRLWSRRDDIKAALEAGSRWTAATCKEAVAVGAILVFMVGIAISTSIRKHSFPFEVFIGETESFQR